MDWVLLSILAAMVFAIVNIIDKYVLTKWVKKPVVLLIVYIIFGIIASVIIFLIHGFYLLSNINIFLAFISGIIVTSGTLLYFKALKMDEVSRLIPIFHLTPLFVLFLATIFLEEFFTPLKYFGIFLLLVGAFLISSKNLKKFRISKASWIILIAALLYAINYVIIKYLLGFADFWTVFSYTKIGAIFVLIPILFFSFKDFKYILKKKPKALYIMSLAETLTLGGILLITIAISISYVTLVNTLSNLQPFFVFLFATMLSIFFPKFLKEKIGKSKLIVKFIAIIILFIGTILII